MPASLALIGDGAGALPCPRDGIPELTISLGLRPSFCSAACTAVVLQRLLARPCGFPQRGSVLPGATP